MEKYVLETSTQINWYAGFNGSHMNTDERESVKEWFRVTGCYAAGKKLTC